STAASSVSTSAVACLASSAEVNSPRWRTRSVISSVCMRVHSFALVVARFCGEHVVASDEVAWDRGVPVLRQYASVAFVGVELCGDVEIGRRRGQDGLRGGAHLPVAAFETHGPERLAANRVHVLADEAVAFVGAPGDVQGGGDAADHSQV